MSHQINITDSLTFSPTGYTGQTNIANENTTYPWSRGYNNSSYTTNYARLQLNASSTSTDCYIYYTFSVSGIPSNATITSVTANVRVSRNSRVGSSTVQLYNGTTAKGSSASFSSTSTTGTSVAVTSITNTGSWTISELSNLRLRITGRRTSTSNTSYIYLWGSDVTITYNVSGTEYEITSTLSTNNVDSIDPAGLTDVMSGGSYTLNIYCDDISNIVVEDNGTDVTSSLVQRSGSDTLTFNPTSFDSSNSSVDGTNVANGYTDETSSSTATFSAATSGTTSIYYNFDCSSIPANTQITSVSVTFRCSWPGGNGTNNTGTTYFSSRTAYLCSGTTKKGSGDTITNTTSSQTATQTLSGSTQVGTWTRADLNNIKLLFEGVHASGNTQAVTCTFWGATLSVTYALGDYYEYSLSNVNADHTIIVGDKAIPIPDEDPQYNYYPITISSINAVTDPGRGTTRVVEGTNQVVTITPSETQVTLILDNGVDVSSQLVLHGGETPSYTVTTASGASYGFNLNSSTGYYVSTNNGQANSAAVARVNLTLPTRCLVTVSYINYAEATYDYGIFGNVDVALGTTYTADTNAKLVCSTSAYNLSTVQTLTYEIDSGSHFIDIKYRKDSATNSNNDSLQFKIDITELESDSYYTYTLSNINQAHSLIFVFGNVSYYFVTSSTNGPKLFPNGQFVILQGDSYKLSIVPEDYNDTISIVDNNVDVTNSLEEVTSQIEKDGQTITVVNYIYRLSNVNATHTIQVTSVGSNDLIYLKVNGSWVQVTKVYKKVNGSWVEQNDFSNLFDQNTIYIKV